MMNQIIIVFFISIILSCNNVDSKIKLKELELREKELKLREKELENKEAKLNLNSKEEIQKKSLNQYNKKIRYLFFSNGGIVAYYDNGTYTGCPRCDFIKTTIIKMFDIKPFGKYEIMKDGSLLRDDGLEEIPSYVENSESANWALIDYKWYVKPLQE